MKITLLNFIEQWAAECGITQSHGDEYIHKLFTLIYKYLREGKQVQLTGFGTFSISHRRPRKGINPRTLEPMQFGAVNVFKFRAGEAATSAIKIKQAI